MNEGEIKDGEGFGDEARHVKVKEDGSPSRIAIGRGAFSSMNVGIGARVGHARTVRCH